MGLLSKAKSGGESEDEAKQATPQTQATPQGAPTQDAVVNQPASQQPPVQPQQVPPQVVPAQQSIQPQSPQPAPTNVPAQNQARAPQPAPVNPPVQNQQPSSAPQQQAQQPAAQVAANQQQAAPENSTRLQAAVPDDLREEVKQDLLNLARGQVFETDADKIYNAVVANEKGIRLNEIVSKSGISVSRVKSVIEIFQKHKAVKVHYSINFLSSPLITIDPTFESSQAQYGGLPENKTLEEEYKVKTDNVQADINVWNVPSESVPIYEVIPHRLQKGTLVLVEHVITLLAEKIPVKSVDLTNPHKVLEAKTVFTETSEKVIRELFPGMSDNEISFLSGVVVHRSYGLGDLEIIMGDNWLEEIAINGGSEPISLYHKRYGWLKTTVFLSKENQIYDLASQISRKVGKQINALNPIMDAHLQTGDRVASTLFPVSTEGDTMTIRRFSRNPWTVAHMVDPKIHTMSTDILSFMWAAVQYELNFMVVGGTASGKTSALNILSALIPPTNRIISIEDTREITLPEQLHWNWVPLVSRSANTEGQGEVTMLDLMVASLRMRPDRIIVGEIRRKQQAEALFEAMHTGHSVAATMHADTAEQIKRRLTQPPIDIPENEIQALQLVLVQYRDRRKGVRRTLELAEFLPATKGDKINLNYLYRWRPRSDEFVKENDSIRVLEDLNLHTGMTQNDFDNDLAAKKDILHWLLANNVKDVDTIGAVMRIYYKYPDLVRDVVRDNGSLQNLLGQQ